MTQSIPLIYAWRSMAGSEPFHFPNRLVWSQIKEWTRVRRTTARVLHIFIARRESIAFSGQPPEWRSRANRRRLRLWGRKVSAGNRERQSGQGSASGRGSKDPALWRYGSEEWIASTWEKFVEFRVRDAMLNATAAFELVRKNVERLMILHELRIRYETYSALDRCSLLSIYWMPQRHHHSPRSITYLKTYWYAKPTPDYIEQRIRFTNNRGNLRNLIFTIINNQ